MGKGKESSMIEEMLLAKQEPRDIESAAVRENIALERCRSYLAWPCFKRATKDRHVE